MTTIGSIGIGLFVLIIIWILALIAFVVSVKLQSNFGWLALLFAGILTIFLVAIPLEKQEGQTEDFITSEKDYTYVYRNLLLAFLIISTIIASIVFFVLHCIEPIRVKPIKSF